MMGVSGDRIPYSWAVNLFYCDGKDYDDDDGNSMHGNSTAIWVL